MAAAKKPAAKKIQDPQRPKPQPKRTDVVGRSGMGESAKSNVTRRAFGPGSATPADRSASEAGKKSNPTRTSIGLTKAYKTSFTGAEKYSQNRTQEMNPRRDRSGAGKAGFGGSSASSVAPARKATGKAISASRPIRPKKK